MSNDILRLYRRGFSGWGWGGGVRTNSLLSEVKVRSYLFEECKINSARLFHFVLFCFKQADLATEKERQIETGGRAE